MDDRGMPINDLLGRARVDNAACAELAESVGAETRWHKESDHAPGHVVVTRYGRIGLVTSKKVFYDFHSGDRMAAWRTAVVALAAAIGKEGK